MDNFDFVAIGDTTTDAFIKLDQAEVTCDIDKENCKICMKFGDKIPFKEAVVVPAVGNSANAAVSAARLGLKSALVSNVGNDRNGEEDIEVLKSENVGTEFIKKNEGRKSNYHYVLLYDSERTILINHEEYDYSLPEIGKPKWVYLSSLAPNSLSFHKEIAKFIEANPETKLAFQPGTFQIGLGYENIPEVYKNSEVFFCNVEEAKRILKIEKDFDDRKEEVKFLIEKISELGPKIVVITDGPSGAYAKDKEGRFWFMPPYPDPAPPTDRTGAGDSFSSTFVSALALDLPVEVAIQWGPVNSMSVVQYIGAREGLLKREDLEKHLKEAPEGYKPTEI